MKRIYHFSLVGLAALVIGCSSSTAPNVPDGDPILRGVIVARDMTDFGFNSPNVHVKENPEVDLACGRAEAVFFFERDPRIFLRTSEQKLIPGSIEDLVVGRSVEVWIASSDDSSESESRCPWTLNPSLIIVD